MAHPVIPTYLKGPKDWWQLRMCCYCHLAVERMPIKKVTEKQSEDQIYLDGLHAEGFHTVIDGRQGSFINERS